MILKKNKKQNKFQSKIIDPVIIIGAPRSGTNMLRDILTSLPNVTTWPCDEINTIWRHGNVQHPSDEFTPAMARPEVSYYIQSQFDWIARKNCAHWVVEKTCANSLRVGFVDRIIPEAKYIFIRRDGLDSVCSALKRWTATLDIPYLARKARFVPFTDVPHYAFGYLCNRMYRLFSSEERLASWGPKIDGMDQILNRYALDEVCALQWKKCVDSAAHAFAGMSRSRSIEIGYENFVSKPIIELQRVLDFLGLQASDGLIAKAVTGVSSRSVGKGQRELGAEKVKRLEPLIRDTQERFGYM